MIQLPSSSVTEEERPIINIIFVLKYCCLVQELDLLVAMANTFFDFLDGCSQNL